MPTLKISYPYLEWHTFEVQVSDEKADEVQQEMSIDEKADFIERMIKTQDIQIEPHELRGALDVDYATIKRVKNELRASN